MHRNPINSSDSRIYTPVTLTDVDNDAPTVLDIASPILGADNGSIHPTIGASSVEQESNKFPPAIPYIIACEACERFSFYGMKTILFTFLVVHNQLSERLAIVVTHSFIAIAYLTPLLGAWLADSKYGKYQTIKGLSIIYTIGQIMIAGAALIQLPKLSATVTMFALLVIAIGTGGIKPNVASFGGDQFPPTQVKQIALFFSWFYFAINFGSVFSTIITPKIKGIQCFGGPCFSVAFVIPAVLMLIATLIFIGGRNLYKHAPVGDDPISRTAKLVLTCIRGPRSVPFFQRAESHFSEGSIRETRAVFRVLLLFLPLPVFWALFDQQSSKWIAQASKMNSYIFGWKLEVETMQVLNAIFILILIPIFAQFVYPAVGKKVELTPLRKMTTGMMVVSLAFVVSAILQSRVEETPGQVNILWQVPQYIIITVGEVLFSITGLEFAYSQAPSSMKSVLSAAWLLTVAFGNIIVVAISASQIFREDQQVIEYYTYAGLMATSAVIFTVLALRYKYVQQVELTSPDDNDRETPAQAPDNTETDTRPLLESNTASAD